MFVAALVLSIASLIGSILFLFLDRAANQWSETIPPWADDVPNTEPWGETGFGRNL